MSVLLVQLASSCGSGPAGGQAAPAPASVTPRGTPSPVVAGAGEARLDLNTHCGVFDAEVGGVYWLADPPLGNGNPPDGWGNPETPGRWQQTSGTTAVFKADSGVTATFVRAVPDLTRGCA